MLDGADPFPYVGCVEQPFPFSLRVVLIISGASMYVVDNNSRSC